MKKTYTAEQIQRKYKDKYVNIGKTYDYGKQVYVYEVRKAWSTIQENTTLGQDVGTAMEYKR